LSRSCSDSLVSCGSSINLKRALRISNCELQDRNKESIHAVTMRPGAQTSIASHQRRRLCQGYSLKGSVMRKKVIDHSFVLVSFERTGGIDQMAARPNHCCRPGHDQLLLLSHARNIVRL